jgi:osmoprotectant transport system permease protein
VGALDLFRSGRLRVFNAARLLILGAFLMAPMLSQAIEDLRVGSDLSTESNVLAEIIRQTALKAGEANVTHELGMGEVSETFTALRTGKVDLYPTSTEMIKSHLLGTASPPDPDTLNRELEKLSLGMSVPLVKKRKYVLAMPESMAVALKIQTISEALGQPQLRFGLSPRFMKDEMGLKRLQQRAKKIIVAELDRYQLGDSLKKKSVDVIDLESTDPIIFKNALRVLQDDAKYFSGQQIVLLHRLDVARRFPKTWERLQLLDNSLTEKILLTLNGKVESGSKKTADAVEEFLSLRVPPVTATTPVQAREIESQNYQPAPSANYRSNLLHTTQRHLMLVLVALALSIVAGIPIGMLAYGWPRFGKFVHATMRLLDIVPFMALLAFCVVLIGTIGTLPALVALLLYGLIPVVTQTHLGLASIPKELRESALLQSLTGLTRFRLIDFPLAAPKILAGIRQCAVVNVGTVAIAALVGVGGYGDAIILGLSEENYGKILSGAIPAALLAIFLHFAFGLFGRVTTPVGTTYAGAK